MLAMTSVGLWAALRGGKAIWAWPAAFVVSMIGGYALGTSGAALPIVEPGILASIIVLGGLVAGDVRAPTALGVGLIALFGAAHGYAHGVEAPAVGGAGFPAGFTASTAVLHGLGLGLGLMLKRFDLTFVLRALGLGAAAGGVFLALAG